MKKIAVAAAALFLAAAMLSGCVSINIGGGNPSPTTKEFTRGTIDGNVYTSEYTDITFTAPDGWVYATDDELASIAGISADIFSKAGMPITEEMLKKNNIYEMMARDPVNGKNVILMFENLAMSPGGTRFTEEQYLEKLISTSNQAQLINNQFGNITDQSIGNYNYKIISSDLPDGCTQYFIVRKIDKYMFAIILTVSGNDKLSDVLKSFS